MKKLIAITLCTAMAISLAGCSGNSSPEDPVPQTSVEIPNPFVDCDTMEDAEKIAGFDMAEPVNIPEGYTQKLIQAVENDMIQIFYANGEKTILIRKAEGRQDISGDYNEYNENNTVTVDGIEVSTKGEEGKINVAVWTYGDFSYAILAESLDTEAIGNMISSMISE